MMRSDYPAPFSVMSSHVSGLVAAANEYKCAAQIIYNDKEIPKTYTFHLLSSLAIELYLKSVLAFTICDSYKDNHTITKEEIAEEINKRIGRYQHNLKRLLDDMPEIKTNLSISSVKDHKNGKVDQYEVDRSGEFFIIKSLTAVRYGLFSKHKDMWVSAEYDDRLMNFLNELEEYVRLKQETTFKGLT